MKTNGITYKSESAKGFDEVQQPVLAYSDAEMYTEEDLEYETDAEEESAFEDRDSYRDADRDDVYYFI